MPLGAITSPNGVGMRSGAIAAAENVLEVRFHHDARGVVLGETAQLPCEPLAGADDGRDEMRYSPLSRQKMGKVKVEKKFLPKEDMSVVLFPPRAEHPSVPGGRT